MSTKNKQNAALQHRYFLLKAEMLISEQLTRVVIAQNADEAEELVNDEIIYQEFSSWDPRGQEHKSAMELIDVLEITQQEYLDYQNQFP